MNDLALRLAELDPQASAAVRVVGHFDSLLASRAGLQSIVRGAAALAGCPVRLVDPQRRLTVRVQADGIAAPPAGGVDPSWPSAPLSDDGAGLWLEHREQISTVQAVVLERAAAVAQSVLARTRSRAQPHDPALVEVVLDAAADEHDRLTAARRLGLSGPCRAVALDGGAALVVPGAGAVPAGRRAGVGTAVEVVDLPTSWTAARLALRLTADGGPQDPGPQVVHAEELGALALLVQAADEQSARLPDVRAVERAASGVPWALVTLEAVAAATSLRDAARALQVHHSSLQDRLGTVEALLGWSVRTTQGRLRLQLALTLRRAARPLR